MAVEPVSDSPPRSGTRPSSPRQARVCPPRIPWCPHRRDRGRAGCSEPMLYEHFRSKQALFAAVLVDASCTAEAAHPRHAAGRLRQRPGGGGQNRCRELSRDPVMIEVSRLRMLAVGRRRAGDPLRARAERHRDAQWGPGSVQRMQEMGTARADIDADQIGWLWLGFVLAAGFRMALEDPRWPTSFPRYPRHCSRCCARRTPRRWLDDQGSYQPQVVDAVRHVFRPVMIMLDNTVVNVALPTIQRSLGHRHPRRVDSQRLRADLSPP